LTPFLRYAKFVSPDIPKPQTEIRRGGREVNARFALVQRGLADVKLSRRLRGTKYIVAKLKTHRHDHTQKRKTDEIWCVDHVIVDKRTQSRRHQNEEGNTPAHDPRPPPSLSASATPKSKRGIDHED